MTLTRVRDETGAYWRGHIRWMDKSYLSEGETRAEVQSDLLDWVVDRMLDHAEETIIMIEGDTQ